MRTIVRNNMSKAVERTFNSLVSKNCLSQNGIIIDKIRSILFSKFNYSWLAQNQKFDFSFSSDEKNKGLRFSYNNFAEKDNYEKKFTDVFLLFKDIFWVDKLQELLDYMKTGGDKHQTTIGFEWLSSSFYPRFKLYFEELFHFYTKQEIAAKLKYICKILKINFSELELKQPDIIGAICVDFLPSKSINLKVYYLYWKFEQINLAAVLKSNNLHKNRRLLPLFLSSLINNIESFYYLTKRFSGGGELLSIKLYKIYEVLKIGNHKAILDEVKDFLKKSGQNYLLDELLNVENICLENKASLMPVITAIDESKDRERIEVYASIRKMSMQ